MAAPGRCPLPPVMARTSSPRPTRGTCVAARGSAWSWQRPITSRASSRPPWTSSSRPSPSTRGCPLPPRCARSSTTPAVTRPVPPRGLASKTLLARGVSPQRAGDLKAAEKSLLQAYEFDPSSPATAFNLAAVLLKEGELERARFYIRRVNNVPAQVTAESLWLAARVEHRLGNFNGRDELAEQLRRRFTGSREATALELGRFDE